jgi:thioredoxin-dependent peroxiredoxin
MLIILGAVLILLIAIPALLIQYSQKASEADRLKVGDRAPDFSLADQYGRTVHLADYAGKKTVILAFYIKAGTPG